MSNSLNFFKSIVKPTVDEFFANTADIRRARLAAIVLNHVADYLVEDGVLGARLSDVRDELIKQCSDFSLIRDVADATKHAKLSRSSSKITNSRQVTRTPGLFGAPFGIGVFAEAAIVYVTLDDGTEMQLDPAIRSVVKMFEEILNGYD